ncbi:ExbD/TolR family protein [Tenacibaculum sp. MEBiC06402]|uniref:ExbD/TolR family protein n=1 Tax=unclassified Tenacibaculum TaxID=2635139 RepID=UPI003B9C1D9B
MKKNILTLLSIGILIVSCQAQIDKKGLPKTLTENKKENTEYDLNDAIEVYIDSDNQIYVNKKKVDINSLKKKIKNFEYEKKSKSIIIFETNKLVDYGFYVDIQNAITGEIKSLRESLARKKYNSNLKNLTDKELVEIQKTYPMRIIDRE